jgi:hypothetical protein
MRVELALFDRDALLDRREILAAATQQTESSPFNRASHKLGNEAAMVLNGNTLREM